MTRTPEDFVGRWSLQRTIRDQLNGQHGALAGNATFTQVDATRLTYDETGTLTLENGVHLEATRQYLWTFSPDLVTVTFSDGGLFHQFVPSDHAIGTDHPCGGDFYKVRYDFTTWPRWTAVWTVTGPRKNYVSTSIYAPMPSPP
ncbi:DUF6314 family protein [Yoonia sp. GPGPB17]|uniref:DUF6314 family protein n=1 Tax=Yoonia sp. GPGPB17 TaxID=3026147 RepID=UPI0030BF511D